MLFVASARVGIVVYSRMAGQLIGATEALAAAGKLAGVGLLARVGANVSCLMLQTVEGLFAERTFVRTWQVWPVIGRVLRL